MIDETDRKIIRELQRDGRISFRKLAKELGTSLSSVSRRVQRLLREDTIRIIAIQPDPEKAGHSTMAMVGLNVETGKIDEVCREAIALDSVVFAGVTYGRFDVMMSIYVDSPKMLLDFIKNKLSFINGIKDVETFYIAEVKKRTPLGPPELVAAKVKTPQ